VISPGNWDATSAVAMGLAALALLAGCGSSDPAATKVRASYSRLLAALASHDSATSCELLFPFGQNQPQSALVTAAHRLAKPGMAAAYRRYVASCVTEVARKPDTFSGYDNIFGGSRLGTISIHGPIAIAAVTSRGGRHARMEFVDAAGEWRIVIGVE
jgi:hypothetical protein